MRTQVGCTSDDGLSRKHRHRSKANRVVDLGYRYDAVGRLAHLVRGDPENASSVVLASYGYDARLYEFDVPTEGGGRRTVRIRDDAAGHDFGPNDPRNRGAHFNDEAGNHYDY